MVRDSRNDGAGIHTQASPAARPAHFPLLFDSILANFVVALPFLLWLLWSIPLRNLEENPMKTGYEAVMSGILDVIPKVVPLCQKNGPPLQVELDS